MKPLQIAVLGAGHLGRIHSKLLAQVEGAQLAAIVDPVRSAREAAAEAFSVPAFESLDKAIGRIDAAIVASPSDCHFEMAEQLLVADKHVFIEKPITTRADHAKQLVDLAKSRRRTLQVGHVERFNPAWNAAADVTRGAKYVEAVRASRFPGRCLDVGVVMDLMIHDIDLVLSLTDAPVGKVRASGLAVVSGHEDIAEARIEFECGLVANLKASRISPSPARSMQCYGPNGFAEIDFSTLSVATVRPDASIQDRSFLLQQATDQPLKFADELFERYLAVDQQQAAPRNAILDELHDFVISIRSKSEPTVSGEAGARAVMVAQRVLEEIAYRRWDRSDLPTTIGPHAIPREGIHAASRRFHQQRKSA
jgi:predicted dehydrogenase